MLILFPVQAEVHCGKINFYYLQQGKKIFQTEDYCIDKKIGSLSNKACHNLTCLQEYRQLYSDLLVGKKTGFGTTGFWICHNLGGSPQIIKVLYPGREVRTMDRCMLKNGGVIDTVSLENYFRSKK